MNWLEIFDWPGHPGEFQSIPKKAFLLQDRITAGEKKLLRGSEIQSIKLLHSIKKSNSNIPEYQSGTESYLEVIFIELTIAEDHYDKYYRPASRLVHKLLPHHCLIISRAEEDSSCHISLYTKSIHPNNPELRVLKEETLSDPIESQSSALLEVLPFPKADKLDLKYFYSYYIRAIQNYNLIPLTGSFRMRDSDHTQTLLRLQSNIQAADSKIQSLLAQLKKETQMRERVRINTEIYKWRTQTTEWKNLITNLLAEES